MKLTVRVLEMVFICWIASACVDKTTVYHSYHPFSSHGWARSDTVCLQVAVPDSNQTYQTSVLIRIMNTYKYTNLALVLLKSDLVKTERDTLYLNLADTAHRISLRNNRPELYEKTIPLGSVHVARPDTLTFRLVHMMKDWSLHGIHDVGIMMKR